MERIIPSPMQSKTSLDDYFKNANAKMLKARASQAERRELSYKVLLDWDKEKHTILTQIDLKKHTETVTMQDKMSGKISSTLCDVLASCMFFASEMRKRMQPGTQQ